MASEKQQFDICIVCALPEEAKAVINEFSRLCGVKKEDIEEGFSKITHYRYPYRCMMIQNDKQEDLRIQISWVSEKGSIDAISHIQSVLTEFTPRFVAMTGICAGDKRKVQLGDLIIADYAFFYDIGKVGKDKEGREVFEPDGKGGYKPLDHIKQYAKMFETWKADVARIPRPPSVRQQRDWLLTKLLEEATWQIPMIPLEELKKNAPAWNDIAEKLQKGQEPDLTSELALRDKASILRLQYERELFPFKDRKQCKDHISPMGSGSAVRKDNPFDDIRKPVRDTVAIDMEGAAFYKMTEYFSIPSLLVKGVCDYADEEKGDSYHTYASRVSAIYILRFVQKYVTNITMPRGGDHQSQSRAGPSPADLINGVTRFTRTGELRLTLAKEELVYEVISGGGQQRIPPYQLLNPCDFDLTRIIEDFLERVDGKHGLIGLAVPCDDNAFLENFGERLKKELGRRNIQVLPRLTLKPTHISIDEAITIIKRCKQALQKREILYPIVIHIFDKHISNTFWQTMCQEFAGNFENRLIVIMGGDPACSFPDDIPLLEPPQFKEAHIIAWVRDVVGYLGWPDNIREVWKQKMVAECSHNNALHMGFVYEHLVYTLHLLQGNLSCECFLDELEQRS